MNKLIPLKSCALTLVLTSVLAISSTLVAATSDPLSRIELVETLAPLIPIEKQMDGDRTRQYTDLASITDPQRLILNGYLAQSNTKSGTRATLFSPDMTATRAQAAVMIHRMLVAQSPQWDAGVTRSVTLIDATTVPWAKKALNALANAAIIQPIGPGYVFPKRAIDAQTATPWIDAAKEFSVKTEPIKIRPEPTPTMDPAIAVPTPSATEPTAAIMTVLTEPATPTEDVTAPTVIQTKETQDHQWQIRAYGGLSLGQSPYQSNQPPAEVVEERYQMADGAAEDLRTTGSGSPKNKRLYGLESGIEFSRKVVDKTFWLVTGYGYGIVKETMPATTITMPVVFYERMLNSNIHNYVDGATEDGRLEIFNLGEHVVRKTTHTLRLGLQHAFYKKTMQKAHIECYWGGGLAISTAAIWGSVLELPQQNINKNPVVFGDRSRREDYITREKVRSFYHTQTQASAYGELGGLASRNSMHVGVQARFQLNPGELSVDEKGNKRLTREISSLGTIFVGRRF